MIGSFILNEYDLIPILRVGRGTLGVGPACEHGRNCNRTTHNQPRGGDNNMEAVRWPHDHRPLPPAARSHPARHPEVAAVCATHTRSCASPNVTKRANCTQKLGKNGNLGGRWRP